MASPEKSVPVDPGTNIVKDDDGNIVAINDEVLAATGDTPVDAAYWAQDNPQGVPAGTATAQTWNSGVIWTNPDVSASAAVASPTGELPPYPMMYQTRQFDAQAPTVSSWQDSSVLDAIVEPVGNDALAPAFKALSDSRAEARAVGNASAPVTHGEIVEQTRTYSTEGVWTGSQNPLDSVANATAAQAAYSASVARAQAVGFPNAPVGSNDVKAAENPVLARQFRQYDPVRNFYDRTSNG